MKCIILILMVAVMGGACSPAEQNAISPTQTPQTASSDSIATPTQESLGAPAQSVESPAGAYSGTDWASISLTDARTGQTFRLADYAGKTVFVEPMATWCTNCRRQIPNVEAARTQVDPNQYVFVGLSVAENVDNATLAQYVDDQGWNFVFAVAPEALIEGMVNSFGRTVVSPPSTPHFIIRPDGSLTDIATGSHSAEELIAELTSVSGA